MGDGAGRDVDDGLAVPGDLQAAGVGDLADDGGLDLPAAGDGEERVEVGRPDDGHHPLLRLAHQHLLGAQGGVAQGDLVEADRHPAVAGGGELAGGAGQPRATEVLDAGDDAGAEQLQAALDEQLLGERVAHLDGGPLGGAAGPVTGAVEGLRGEHRDATDAVAAGAGAEEDHEVALTRGAGQVDVLVAHGAHAEGVHQGVALVHRVEDDLAADVGQAQAVAVAADAGHHAGDDAGGVGVVERPEAQRVHDGDGTGAHGEDVAHDAADAGGRALVGLHEARVVVALDLEGHRPAAADVDDAGVLADADEQRALHLLGGLGAELPQVRAGGLVGAVLAPHHRVHRQLARRGTAVEGGADAAVLVVLEAQLPVGELVVGRCGGVVHRVEDAHGPRA